MTVAGDFLLVLTTLPDPERARTIAAEVVRLGLAACVSVLPGVHSVFQWQGKLDHADECLLLLKTTSKRYRDLESRLVALHPYELPEIIALPLAAGLDNYLTWIEKNTGIQ
jgi:periplasmic divalent cation tolerance protein